MRYRYKILISTLAFSISGDEMTERNMQLTDSYKAENEIL
jgi:hypothetical protein